MAGQQPAQQITPEDALATIDQAIATIKTDRSGHVIMQSCISALQSALAELKALKDPPSSTP